MDRGRDVLGKQAITDAHFLYCRALGRNDRAMADSVWRPRATADYQNGDRKDGASAALRATAGEFLDSVFARHTHLEGTSRQVTNILIDLRGDTAESRACVTAALWPRADVITIRARYIDAWSRHDGRWAMNARVAEHDLRRRNDLAGGKP